MSTFPRLRKLTVAIGAMGMLGAAGMASADPISYLPSNTDIRIKFTNYEIEVTQLGQELFGLINVTSITNAAGTQTFWNGNGGTDGTQLVGYFEGLTAVADQRAAGGLSFTGGQVVLYNVSNGLFSPTTSPDTKDYANQLCGGACGTPWLVLDFVPGINDAFGPTADAGLQSAFAGTDVQTGNGFLGINSGTNASFFDTNTFNFTNFSPADMSLRSNFALQGANCSSDTAAGWSVCSDDPISARTVPEPGSVALIGIAALAGGLAWRRKRPA